ncbi:hypothetical protein WSK_1888 [Novosphingobium sp. Rr 2-17]|nr:hypothetical protein WSK_1888 [Novosphingobium sp. Rr 2-17]
MSVPMRIGEQVVKRGLGWGQGSVADELLLADKTFKGDTTLDPLGANEGCEALFDRTEGDKHLSTAELWMSLYHNSQLEVFRVGQAEDY